MGHKLNDFSKEIGSAFLSAGKLFGAASLFKSKQIIPEDKDRRSTSVQSIYKDESQNEVLTSQTSLEDTLDTGGQSLEESLSCLEQKLVEERTPDSSAVNTTLAYDSEPLDSVEDKSDEIPFADDSTLPYENELLIEPVLNYEISDDCRSRLLEQCKLATRNGIDLLPKRIHTESENIILCTEEKPFLFDIVNCRVSDFSCAGTSKKMPIYACMDDKEPSLCHQHGIYTQTLVDSYELFHDDREETRHLRHSILRRSLEEIIGSSMPVNGCRFMCLMPDVVDDFDQVFRAQLNYKGTPLFQVPRSIALAYTLQAEGWSLPDVFLCLDYDGEDFFAIKICNVPDEDGDHIFIRMGREKLDGNHPSTRELSLDYLRRYQDKYGLALSEDAISNLVNTKRLQHLLFEGSQYLLLDNNGTVAPIYADAEILDEIAERIYDDMGQIQDAKGMTVYAMCGLFNDPSGNLYNISQMEIGCKEICTRADQGKTLWQEYLPDLKLEVNRDGHFGQIQLIGETHRRQNINAFVLDEKVRIPVVDGTVTFPANGAKHYDLPLVREVFGRHAKEKMARFVLEKPLKKSVQVELSVHYQYGDIDSYRLVAHSKELDQTIQSFWCDTESLTLSNPAPSFSEAAFERRIISEEEIEKVYTAFLKMDEKINWPGRPPRIRYTSLYPGKSNWYYSKYLFELNAGGQPYFMIQNFLKKEHFPVTKTYIAKLLNDGVFSVVGRILHGELPLDHNLGVDEQTGLDESRVLITNMADIAKNFGIFFSLYEFADIAMVHNAIEGVLSYYKRKRYLSIQDWAPITKYVRSTNDPHDIWGYFVSSLSQLNPQRPEIALRDLRAISGVCFQTENWIFDLYHTPKGRDEIERIIKSIIAVLYGKNCLSAKTPQDKYNPRVIRDVLELLLCICRLKKEDPTILDCNETRTKQLVKQLKKIDSDMRSMKENGQLQYPFNSRLGITAPEAYSQVNPVIYALIETLSGGEQVSLIGFSDEEDDD